MKRVCYVRLIGSPHVYISLDISVVELPSYDGCILTMPGGETIEFWHKIESVEWLNS